MKRSWIIIFTLCIVFLCGEVGAFCVYNQTDKNIAVEQTAGGKGGKDFFANLEPGKRSCCNWKNRDCNKSGKRDAILKFDVYYKNYSTICSDFPVKAGGWLVVKRKGENYYCEAGF